MNQERYAYKGIAENPVILDFSKCKYLSDVHKILKIKFGLPDYYGENPDALWDSLDDLFDEFTEITVEIHGFNALEKDIKYACVPLLEVFEDIYKKSPNFVYKIIS